MFDPGRLEHVREPVRRRRRSLNRIDSILESTLRDSHEGDRGAGGFVSRGKGDESAVVEVAVRKRNESFATAAIVPLEPFSSQTDRQADVQKLSNAEVPPSSSSNPLSSSVVRVKKSVGGELPGVSTDDELPAAIDGTDGIVRAYLRSSSKMTRSKARLRCVEVSAHGERAHHEARLDAR